jgi:hypothetical protein
VDLETGRGVGGVQVSFLSEPGAAASLPSVVTSGEGRWQTSVPAEGEAALTGRFRVEAPGRMAYETAPMTIPMVTRGGSEELGRWTTEPFFAFIGELRFPDGRPRSARVVFRRTGGAETNSDRVSLRTDPAGRFLLRMELLEAGEVVGDFQVSHSDLPETVWIRGVTIPFKHSDDRLLTDRVLRMAPSLDYVGRLMRRSAGELVPVEGIETEFRRIGGIEVSPSVVRSVTVDWGGFSMVMTTWEAGEVEGVLSAYLPPQGEPVVLDTLTLATFDADTLRVAGEWAFGPQVNYEAGIRDADTAQPLAGLEVEFRRTGGIPTEPETVQETTDDEGLFPIRLHVEETGPVEGEIRAHRGAGQDPVVIPGIVIEAREDDDVHFLGWFDI